MSDAPDLGTSSEAPVEAAEVATPDVNSGPADTSYDASTGADNPAWEPYKGVLKGPLWEAVKPLLAEDDKRVNSRFETIRNEYKPLEVWKGVEYQPDQVKEAMPIVDMLNNDPVQFYQMLAQHPQVAASLQQAVDFDAEPETDTDEGDVDPRIQQLEQQVAGFQQMLEQQAQAEAEKAMDAQVETEVQDFRAKHKDLTDQDMTLIFDRIQAEHARTGKVPSWEDAAAPIISYRDSVRTTPRPGDGAPLVMPTNGGAPSANSAPALGKLSSKDTRGLLAALIDNAKSQG